MEFEDIEVGMAVKVVSSTHFPDGSTRAFIGKEAKVVKMWDDSIVSVHCKDLDSCRDFHQSDLEPVQEATKYITGDAIKDAPTGLYRVHCEGETKNGFIYADDRGNKRIQLSSEAHCGSLSGCRTDLKLEPLYLDEPIKAKPVPIVGKLYYVTKNKGDEEAPMFFGNCNGDQSFWELNCDSGYWHTIPLDDVHAWDEKPIERIANKGV